LDTGFIFALSRSESAPAGIVARIKTTATYPCTGYRLQTHCSLSNDSIFIQIGGLVRPTTCFTAFDIAKGETFLGEMKDEQRVVVIFYRGARDIYLLSYKRGKLFLEAHQQHFTETENSCD
jgi:hypothetical protein